MFLPVDIIYSRNTYPSLSDYSTFFFSLTLYFKLAYESCLIHVNTSTNVYCSTHLCNLRMTMTKLVLLISTYHFTGSPLFLPHFLLPMSKHDNRGCEVLQDKARNNHICFFYTFLSTDTSVCSQQLSVNSSRPYYLFFFSCLVF